MSRQEVIIIEEDEDKGRFLAEAIEALFPEKFIVISKSRKPDAIIFLLNSRKPPYAILADEPGIRSCSMAICAKFPKPSTIFVVADTTFDVNLRNTDAHRHLPPPFTLDQIKQALS